MGIVTRYKHGGVEYPLVAETTNALLADADPAIYYALRLFESVLNDYVGPRLLAQAALEGLNLPSAVEKTIHFEPTPFLLSDQLTFPLLCLYRSEEGWTEQNKSFNSDLSVWEWAYVLPPMTPRQIEQLHPILRSVAVTISAFAMQSYDPGYEEGTTLRELSGIQKMTAGRVRYGSFEAAEGVGKWWRAVTGQLLVQERDDIVVEAFEKFEGANFDVDLTNADGTQVAAFVEVDTPPNITLTDVNPKSGSKAGGTLIQIDGEGFRPGMLSPKVLVGGAYATNVVVLHPTRLRCVTPEHEAQPTHAADVQVIDDSGMESNVLEGAYTFTTP